MAADEGGYGIAVDSLGQAYVTGQTTSTNFPVVGGFQTTLGNASGDAFITKINAAGNALVYSTYLGGNGTDQGQGIAADPMHPGIVYVTGNTISSNLRTKNGFQSSGNVFVAKIDTTFTGEASLLYSTYLGGSGGDSGLGIAADGASAYVTGRTAGFDAPPPSYGTLVSGLNIFVARIDTSTSSPVGLASVAFLAYLGGGSGNAIAVDTIGDAYVTGLTFGGFPVTPDAFQQGPGGNGDAFVVRLNTDVSGSSALVFGSYLGGSSGVDQGLGIALDPSGDGYVTGSTSSGGSTSPTKFPTTSGGFQTENGGTTDAFVARISDIAKTADLSITKTGPGGQVGQVGAGDQFTYTLSVKNAGPNAASKVTVSDTLPAGVTLVSASGSSWSCSPPPTTTVTCTLASLAAPPAPTLPTPTHLLSPLLFSPSR